MNRQTGMPNGQLGLLTFARWLIDTGQRIVFPFLPIFARGLGVSPDALRSVLALRSVPAFVIPFVVPFSERVGRKPFILFGLICVILGGGVAVAVPSLAWFGAALMLMALGKIVLNPVLHAYLGDRVAYERRGRAVALLETAWALSLLIGAPLAGVLIARLGWQSPFGVVSLVLVAVLLLVWRILPESKGRNVDLDEPAVSLLKAVREHPVVWGAGLYSLLMMGGNTLVYGTYAEWIEGRFGVELGGLGLAAVVLGSSELLGEGVVGFFTDRIGKRRLTVGASALAGVAYMVIPFSDASRGVAFLALFVVFFFFEISVVGSIPLFAELVPEARSVGLSVTSLAAPLGRSVGLILASVIQAWGGFLAVAVTAGVMTLMGTVVFWLFVREPG